jgi:hypothetical protein
MFAILHAAGRFVADLFKSRLQREAEILLLRHQLTIAMRRAPPRLLPGIRHRHASAHKNGISIEELSGTRAFQRGRSYRYLR